MYDKKFEKSHKRLLSIFQNTFAKLFLEKERWNKPKNSIVLLYNDNAIVKLYFSNNIGKNMPITAFKKWLSIFQNTFTKLYLETTLKSTKKIKKLLYKDNTIAKLYFSNETGKKVQM